MILAGVDLTLGDLIWSLLWMFMLVIWFWLLITVFGDLFRDKELSGVAKALWVIFVIVAPFLGILLYLITRGGGMADRALQTAQDQQAQYAAFVQQAAASQGVGSPAAEIERLSKLHDQGKLTDAEFSQAKQKLL